MFLLLSGQEASDSGLKRRISLRAYERPQHLDFAIVPVGYA